MKTKLIKFGAVRAGNEFVTLRFEPLCVFGFGLCAVDVEDVEDVEDVLAEYAERSGFSA